MKFNFNKTLLLLFLFSSCTFLFGKSLPPLQEISKIEKEKIAIGNNYNFKAFAKGFIRVNSEISRLRIIMLCDNSNNRFRVEVIPSSSSIPLGIITGNKGLYKFYSPANKKLVSNTDSSELINELMGIKISDSDICSIFSKKINSKTAINLKKIIESKTDFINVKTKNEYTLNQENFSLERITLGKYTNSYKVFTLSNSGKSIKIDSDEIDISGKFNFVIKEVKNFKENIFKL